MNVRAQKYPTCRALPYVAMLALAAIAPACETAGNQTQTPSEGGTAVITQPGQVNAPPANSNQPASVPTGVIPDTTTQPAAGNSNVPVAGGNTTLPATTPVATNGNTPLPNGNDVAITPIKAIASPAIGFDAIPRNDNKAIALTFDDGPDGLQGATDMVLDILKKENLKAHFFICANIGFADLETDPIAQRQLKRIVAEGHSIGNHSYAHKDLATLATDAELEAAFAKLETIYKKVLGPTAPVITTIRAPFGSPFQLDPAKTVRVAPVVTKYGVEVGWGMDPKDWSFDHFSKDPAVFQADVKAVIDSVQKLIDNKQWGAILLHSVHLPSATALPTIITMLRQAGYHFISVEDVIRSQYGANSASIMAANKAAIAAGTMPQ